MDYTLIRNSPEGQCIKDFNGDTPVTTIMESSSFPSISRNRASLSPPLQISPLLLTAQPGIPLSPLLYFNTCDKVSISEICHDVMSLNSSIGDIVDALFQENFQGRGINFRKGVEVREQSDLVKVAWQYTGKKDTHMRRPIFDAVLHDLITGFINDILKDSTDSISQEFKHFRRTAARVMTVEQFAEAQNWKRIAAKHVDPPPAETWDALSRELVHRIERGCWPFTGKSPRGWKKPIKLWDEDRLPSLIRSAYTLAMKIDIGILSENLNLVTAKKGPGEFDPGFVEVLQELEMQPTEYFPCPGRRASVLGNRGFGLVSTLEDGNERVYIKVPITSGKPEY